MMKYRLDGFVSKISSHIILKTGDSEEYFESGADLAVHDFFKRYSICSLYAENDHIVIEAKETKIEEPFNYAGEAALL